MAENSKIEWTDHTFNPWEGCQKVGPGCDHCYAEARNARFGGGVAVNWGPGAPRRRTSAANWNKPVQWNAEKFWQCKCGWRGADREIEQMAHLEDGPDREVCPSCDRPRLTPARARVFCASLADVFDNEVPDDWRRDLATLIIMTPNLDWLLLTKRIGNARDMLADMFPAGMPPNVWLGATIVNREEMLRDAPKLKVTPAAVHFWSGEPLLGDLGQVPRDLLPDWVIIGGESGPGARDFDIGSARDIVKQCKAAGVAVHVKQLGASPIFNGCSSPGEHWPPGTLKDDRGLGNWHILLHHKKGGDWNEWPEDLRVREFPETRR
jgi:protein gp37